MTEITKTPRKLFDLEERTLKFALDVRIFCESIDKTLSTMEDWKQLLRCSGSVGANYVEANEALSKKDFLMRIKICRKEAKECCYWLKILARSREESEFFRLFQEASELMNIFGSIMRKVIG